MKLFKVYTKEKGIIETGGYNDLVGLTLHREDGPAVIKYYENGNIEHEAYYVNNKMHRLDGPAAIWYNRQCNIQYVGYWIYDDEYTKEQYYQKLLQLKLQSL